MTTDDKIDTSIPLLRAGQWRAGDPIRDMTDEEAAQEAIAERMRQAQPAEVR